jgi:hypothetical protein
MREHNAGGIIIGRRRPKYLKNYPPQYNFVHKSFMDSHGTELGHLRRIAGD